jgi:asparagine synthetase B (glutamine-hydrolysing)
MAWLDTKNPDTLHIARLDGSPLFIGSTDGGSLVFASTRPLLTQAAEAARLKLAWVTEVKPYTYMRVEDGKRAETKRIPRPPAPKETPKWEKYPVFQSQAQRAFSRGATLFPLAD